MSTPRRLRASGMLETRDGTPANKDSRLVNCIMEPNGEELDFLKRPGYSSLFSPASGNGKGAILVTKADGTLQILSIVANTLYASIGTPAASWTARSAAEQNQWRGMAWSPRLGLFAAVALDGTNRVMTSPDGITWTARSAAAQNQWAAITWAPELGIFCAVSITGSGNRVMTSADGITWTSRTSAANEQWQCVAWNGTRFVAGETSTGTGNTGMTSTDGINWSSITTFSNAFFTGIVYAPGLALWVGVGSTGRIGTSPDGLTWTLRDTTAPTVWRSVAWSPELGLFVAVGDTGTVQIKTSPDGLTWTTRTKPAGNAWISVAWAAEAGLFLSVSYTGGLNNAMSSPDGINWTLNTTPASNAYDSIAWSPELQLAAAASSDGTNRIMTAVYGQSFGTSTVGTLAIGGLFDFSQTLDRTKIAIKNAAGAWQYTVASGALDQVVSASYPTTTVRGLAYLDGTFYVMDSNGVIYGSAVNDFTSWSALNFINAQSEPDGGVCIIKYNQYVVAFGNYTTEFFYDAGNPTGSPLAPVQNSVLLIGCANGDCVAQAQASVFFPARSKAMGQSVNSKIFIAELSGMSYQRVSNPDVDRIVNADGLGGAWAWFGVWMSHPCYNLCLPTTGYLLVYDLVIKDWYIFTKAMAGPAIPVTSITCSAAYAGATIGVATATVTSHGFADGDPVMIAGATPAGYNGTFNITYVDANTFTYPTTTVLATASGTITATGSTQDIFPALCAFNYSGTQIFQNQINGGMYTMSDTLYTDDNQYIDTKIRTMRFDAGLSEQGNSQNKFMPWLDLISDKRSTATYVYIRFTDDDYQTYSNYRAVDISLSRSRIARCGAFIRRAFEIRHTASSAFRMQGMDLGLEQGGE